MFDRVAEGVDQWFKANAQELGAGDVTVQQWCKNQLYYMGLTVPEETDARVYWYEKMGSHQYEIRMPDEKPVAEEAKPVQVEPQQDVGAPISRWTHGVAIDMEPVSPAELQQLVD